MFSIERIVVMTVVHRIEDFVQVVVDTRFVLELKVEQPAVRDVLDKSVRRHAQREEHEAYYRISRPERKQKNERCVAGVEGRSLVEVLAGNPSLLLFIKT